MVQECGAGLIRLKQGARLAFAAPPLVRVGEVDSDTRSAALSALGITSDDIVDISWVDNGPGWVGVLLHDVEQVLALEPNTARHPDGQPFVGVVAPHHPEHEADFEVRGFFPTDTGALAEDPVTGSLNAALAQWLIGTGRAPAEYLASQGTALGRNGRVLISTDEEGQVWVGGDTKTLVSGEIDL